MTFAASQAQTYTLTKTHSGLDDEIFEDLEFTSPKLIYTSICKQTRVLPINKRLEYTVSEIYTEALKINITNIYNNSPAFYAKNIADKKTFLMYQCFIYLLVFIEHVMENYESKDVEMYPEVVKGWCITRRNSDSLYFITGPLTQTEYNVDYKNIYKSYISPSISMESLQDYLQLMSSEAIEKSVMNVDLELQQRPNAHSKLNNDAQCYHLNLEGKGNLFDGDLIFDYEFNSGVTTDSIAFRLTDTIKEESEEDPKSQAAKLTKLLQHYNSIIVNNLKIKENCFVTPLDIFDEIYLVFPGIIGVTNLQSKLGSFSIPGKIVNNEFIANYPISYDPKTIHVKNLNFKFVVQDDYIRFNQPYLRIPKSEAYNCLIGDPNSRFIKFNVDVDGEALTMLFDRQLNLIKFKNQIYEPDKQTEILKGFWTLDNLKLSESKFDEVLEIGAEINYKFGFSMGMMFKSKEDYTSLNNTPVLRVSNDYIKIFNKNYCEVLYNDSSLIKLKLELK